MTMKLISQYLFILFVMLTACGKTSNQAQDEGMEEPENENPNQALYDKVMDVHDEVMPKMEDIYKIKSQIKEQIANSPNLVTEKKEALEKLVFELDSANNLMMEWMHQFKPLPDSADEEEARAYLESQMEKIIKVKQEMLNAIEKGNEQAIKN